MGMGVTLAGWRCLASGERRGTLVYLHGIADRLSAKGIRVEVDDSDDRFPKKIRNASKSKVPFVLIAGEEDRSHGAVSFRYRDGSQKNGVPVDEAIAEVLEAVESRRQV